MKISYNWLRQYISTELSAEAIGEMLTNTGLEVEAIEKIESIRGGLEGVVVGHVVTCEKHPGADKLSITKVDVGNDEFLPIVCGAPNVKAGQKVLVAMVGTKLYPIGAEKEFKIEKAKIRGEVSLGMICAEDELGIGTSHDGIMILSADAPIGQPAAEYLKLENDFLIEIGLTPNRTDAFAHVGVARDLAAFLSQEEKIEIQWPDISAFKPDSTTGNIKIQVEDAVAAPRYCGLLIEGVVVKPSPEWLQNRLRTIGLKPINNVVDITNFVLHEMGQPLHAFNADVIDGALVRVGFCAENTEFETLDGVKRKLSASDLMINSATQPLCIAGVFGGNHSGVSESTTRVFLESACFNASSIRKSAKRHGLNTDASFRFERGVDPNLAPVAIKRAALLIKELAGGKIATDVIDFYPNPVQRVQIEFSLKRCEMLIGQHIAKSEILAILKSLDFEILRDKAEDLLLSVPTYRVDVTREADVIEEILRIYGYNQIDIPEKLNASLSYSKGISDEAMRNLIADMLASNGFVEMMSNSLSSSANHLKMKSAQLQPELNVAMLNPLSSELDILRRTLAVNMLEAVAFNQNRKNADLRLFEMGKVYERFEKGYRENLRLALLMTGSRYSENWNNPKEKVSYFDLRNEVDLILQRLGLSEEARFGEIQSDWYEDGQSITIRNKKLGELGWIKPAIATGFGVDEKVYMAEIDWEVLFSVLGSGKIKFAPIPKFPTVRRDFSLLLDASVQFDTIEKLARKAEKKLLVDVGLFDVYEGKNLGPGKKSYAVRFLLRDNDKTLTDAEVDKVMGNIRQKLETELGASLR